MGKSGLRDIDRGWKALKARISGVDKMSVTVGVQGAKGAAMHAGGISNVRLAGVHEFGATITTPWGKIVIPERSFIRSTMIENSKRYESLVKRMLNLILDGKLDAPKALALIGEKITSDMKRKIERGVPPANADSTIAAKGSSTPLVDHGQLKNSITYEVHHGDGGGT